MFAAYSSASPSTSAPNVEEKAEEKPSTPSDWLANASYVPPVGIQIDDESANDSDCQMIAKVKKDKKKDKKKKTKRKTDVKVIAKPPPPKVAEIKWGFVEQPCAFTDRAGSTDNFAFPATYSRQTARYRLTVTRGTVVSSKRLPARMLKVFFPAPPNDKKKKDLRYYSRVRLRKFTSTPVVHRHAKKAKSSADAWSDTVLVHQPSQLDADGNELVWDAGVQMYREKRATDERHSPESQRIALLAAIMSSPVDMVLWHRLAKVLALIRTKNAFATNSHADGDDAHVRETDERRQSINERLLDVVERVVKDKYASINATPTPLVLLRMTLVVHLWPREKVEAEWRQLTFHRINDVRIWRERIRQMKMGAEFTTEKVTAMYASAIEKLSLVATGRVASHKPSATASTDLLALVIDYIDFVKVTGHTERALAVAQALVEFNFYRPPGGTLAKLAEWWEGGVPRFGDEGAVGWKNAARSSTSLTASSARRGVDLVELESGALEEVSANRHIGDDPVEQTAKCWRALERLRLTNEWTATTADDDENDDVDAVIALEDVRPFVVDIAPDDAHARFDVCQMIYALLDCPMEMEVHSSEAKTSTCDLTAVPSLAPPIATSPFVDVVNRLAYVRRLTTQLTTHVYADEPLYSTYFTCRLLGTIFATIDTPAELDRTARTTLAECPTQHPLYYLVYARAIDRLKGDASGVLKQMTTAVSPTLAVIVNGTETIDEMDVRTCLAVTNAYLLHAIEHSAKPQSTAVHVANGVYGRVKGESMTAALRLINTMRPTFDVALAVLAKDNKERPASTRSHASLLLNGWLGTLPSLLTTTHVLLACACSITSIVPHTRLLDEADYHDEQLLSTLEDEDRRRDVLQHCIERRACLRVRLVRRHVELDRMATPRALTLLLKAAVDKHPNNMWLMRVYVDNVNSFDRLTVRLHFARHLDADMFVPARAAQLYGAVYAECRRYISSVDSMNLSTGRASLVHLTSTLRQVLEVRPALLDLWLLWMRIENDSHTLRRYVRSTGMPAVESVYYLAATAAPYALCVQTLFTSYSTRHWRRTLEVIAERRLRLRCAPEEVHMLMNAVQLTYDDGRRDDEEEMDHDDDA